MQLWVGLGNPESGMARNRHNIGFMAVDVIAGRHGFSPWRQRFKGLAAEGFISGMKVLALKPLTYMNVSGESVQAAAAFFKILPEAIVAFHDELDLAPGKVRVKKGGGAAFFIKQMKVPQIRKAVKAVGLLPQKSTYFYPKIGTGLVLKPLYKL